MRRYWVPSKLLCPVLYGNHLIESLPGLFKVGFVILNLPMTCITCPGNKAGAGWVKAGCKPGHPIYTFELVREGIKLPFLGCSCWSTDMRQVNRRKSNLITYKQEFHKNIGPKNKWVNWSFYVIQEEEKGEEVRTAKERRAIYRKMNKSKHLVTKCLLGHEETMRQRGLGSSSLANLPQTTTPGSRYTVSVGMLLLLLLLSLFSCVQLCATP